jgi:hypothetical protein
MPGPGEGRRRSGMSRCLRFGILTVMAPDEKWHVSAKNHVMILRTRGFNGVLFS